MPEHPVFFIDRSLGRLRVPEGLRAAGWQVVTLAEHYGHPQDESVRDEDWLALAGEQNWAVLMKDERIRYREAERRALMASGVHAFCLVVGGLKADEMVEVYVRHGTQIKQACNAAGPSLYAVTRSEIRKVELRP